MRNRLLIAAIMATLPLLSASSVRADEALKAKSLPIAKDYADLENGPEKLPAEAALPATAENAVKMVSILRKQTLILGTTSNVDYSKRMNAVIGMNRLFTQSLSLAGRKVSTTLPLVADSLSLVRLGTSDIKDSALQQQTNEQAMFAALLALQNARIIEQNDRMIELMEKQVAKK